MQHLYIEIAKPKKKNQKLSFRSSQVIVFGPSNDLINMVKHLHYLCFLSRLQYEPTIIHLIALFGQSPGRFNFIFIFSLKCNLPGKKVLCWVGIVHNIFRRVLLPGPPFC